jgi:hypothetical protein
MSTEQEYDFSVFHCTMKFPYNAVQYFDEFDDEIMKVKITEHADGLKQKGHTCVHIGSYYVGWCGYDICENNNAERSGNEPKSALD